jgi:hypothetical protein
VPVQPWLSLFTQKLGQKSRDSNKKPEFNHKERHLEEPRFAVATVGNHEPLQGQLRRPPGRDRVTSDPDDQYRVQE